MERETETSRNTFLYVATILSVVVVGFIMFSSSELPSSGDQAAQVLEQKKEHILEKVHSPEPLSSLEKREIFDSIAGGKIHEYNLTKEEKFRLIQAFNNK